MFQRSFLLIAGSARSLNTWVQKPMLELLHKNLDSKGKQAKLKSPQELQVNTLSHDDAVGTHYGEKS